MPASQRTPGRRAALLLGCLAAAGTAVTGCSPEPEPSREGGELRLARQYFRANNAAARRGPAAQQEFLRRTQHPDFSGQSCDLGDVTVSVDPALSTLRPDPGFAPGGVTPRGDIRVVGVEVTVRRDRVAIATQIGSQHLVYLGGRVYGFAPCPR